MTNYLSHFKYDIFYRDKRFVTIKIFKNLIYIVKRAILYLVIMFFIRENSNGISFLFPSAAKRPHEKEKKKGSVGDTTY